MPHLLVMLLTLAGATEAAQVSIVTRCTGIEGYSYVTAGPLAPAENAGWQRDALKGGSFLIMKAGEEYDIVYVDAAARTVSTREDDGAVITVAENPGELILLTIYRGGPVETYTLKLDDRGTGTLMHALNRFGGPLERYSLMRATCSK